MFADFKMALNPLLQISLNFAKSYILAYWLYFNNKKWESPTILDKSLGTNVYLWLFTNTRNKESCDIQPTRAQHLPPPHLQCWKHVPATFSDFVLGGGGGNCNVVLKYGNAFRRSAQIFDNYGFCITVPRYFVQDCSSFFSYRIVRQDPKPSGVGSAGLFQVWRWGDWL